jgi:hypothetical protein
MDAELAEDRTHLTLDRIAGYTEFVGDLAQRQGPAEGGEDATLT